MTQQQALDILKLGNNVYLTGAAGSGKTFVLNRYIDYLKSNGVGVAITASTGIAATHLGGITIHSWSGLGIRNELSNADLEAMGKKKYLMKHFQNTKVLIIDEVSMLQPYHLDLVNEILQKFKDNDEPFGGVQVVLSGDFFQLPPVSGRDEPPAEFVFTSPAWRALRLKVCYLEEQHRQSDSVYLSILGDIRANRVSERTREYLKSRYKKSVEQNEVVTKLYTHNIDVDAINEREFAAVPGDITKFYMTTRGSEPLVKALQKSCLAPQELRLKIGARVMFVKNNFEMGYVNGTLGEVVEFDLGQPVVMTTKGERIVANFQSWRIEEDGKTKAEITQIPLRLAWAITIHKSQGMSLDAIEVDLSRSFEKGMGYVALSRVRTLAGLNLLGINQFALQVHEDIQSFDESLLARSEEAEADIEEMGDKEKAQAQKEYLKSIAPSVAEKKKKVSTYEATREFAAQGFSLDEMAKERGMAVTTILGHLEKLVKDRLLDPNETLVHLKPEPEIFQKIETAFRAVRERTGEMRLAPAHEVLKYSFSFDELRLVRLFMEEFALK